MVKLLGRADGEAGGLFVVERAAGAVICASFFEWDTFADHVNDVNTIKKLLNETFRYQNVRQGLVIALSIL